MSKIFKCGFDIADYKDVLPNVENYCKQDYILNSDDWSKGNVDSCVWKKYIPTLDEINSPAFREQEARRILKTGAWACISEEIVWIPPSYYFALQYGKVGEEDLEFRLKRLKHVYFKIKARNNPRCKGTLTVKNRADGETTMSIIDAFWECLEGNMNSGQIGIQSKTNEDAKNPCWYTIQILWQNLPQWLKNDLCSDFDSGDNIEQKMKFMRDADEEKGTKARNILIKYYPSVYNAMDGKHNMKKCILDEVCKWNVPNAGFYATYNN